MQAASTQPLILVVDDDQGLIRLIAKALQREGFKATTATSGQEALSRLASETADLLLLDLKLQDMEGRELVERLSAMPNPPPFVIMTGQGDERVAVEMMKRGARDYLVKDVDFLQFVPEVVRHVLDQIQTERRLAAAEERVNVVQSVVDRGFSAVLIANGDAPDPEILYVNPSFAELTGYDSARVVGRRLSSLQELGAIRDQLGQGASQVMEEVSSFQTADGERWGEWRVGSVRDKNGRITNWLVILRDISDRKRLEKEILEISDREQRRIGQDLHDGLCQQLAGIELMSQALEQKIAPRSKIEAQRAGEIAGHVREAIRNTRLLARGLSPVTLESEGMTSALQEFASNTEKIFHVNCSFDCPQPVLVQDQAVATHLFRIAQESVSNAIKHGKATRIVIRLRPEHGRLVLEITDNGRGFPEPIPHRDGMGLRIMQSRAAMIGGTLRTENAGGARVICTVPLKAKSPSKGNSSGRRKKISEDAKADSDR